MMWMKMLAYAGPGIEGSSITDDHKCGRMTTNRERSIKSGTNYNSGAAIKLITPGGSTDCSTYTGKSDTIIIRKPW